MITLKDWSRQFQKFWGPVLEEEEEKQDFHSLVAEQLKADYGVLREKYLAQEDEIKRLRAGLEYVLQDEPNLIPRASSECRSHIRRVLTRTKTPC
jgi:hypothetical protein